MKWKTLCLSAALTAALTAVPAYALDYTVDAPEDHLFGRPTSVETATEYAASNVDRSKNTALIPPAFGSPTSYLPNTGEPLTPNLMPGALSGGLLNSAGGTGTVSYPMRTAYAFTRYQNDALDELLADRVALASLASSLTITNADAAEVLQNLPDDLSPERRAVVQNALTLYGKVSYFWGGKSLVLGWDSRWGQLWQVTAAGSSTTGTYRPYGLDCSGFVDWAFYNATGGSYIIGHGGGATMQHGYCTDISWQDAQPGDLVFYPDNSHVGIICGRDETGKLLVIHCASGANNVVITGTSGFVSVARPEYYGE